MSYTKGVWRIHANNKGFNIEALTQKEEVKVGTVKYYQDAQIISASPDLLEACEVALGHSAGGDPENWLEIEDILEKAINKAKGV